MDTNEKVEELNAKFCNGETDLSDILREAMAWRVREDAKVAEHWELWDPHDSRRQIGDPIRITELIGRMAELVGELSRIADEIEKGNEVSR